MDKLRLKPYPDPCLRIKTKPVEEFNGEVEDSLRSMADLMYLNGGIGLAATQVGLGLRLLVIDAGDELIKIVNPTIVEKSKEKDKMEEGCLSLPGIGVKVSRPVKVKVRAQDSGGKFFVRTFESLKAKALQHEIDHLNGKLIIDYLDPIRRLVFTRRAGLFRNKGTGKTCEVVCNARDENIR